MNKQTKTFIISIITLFVLMSLTYVLTLVLDCPGISFLKWIGSPILVLGSDDSSTLIAIIIFLLIIGGVMEGLNNCGFLEYMINKIINKYGDKKYLLIYILALFFMAMGSFIGSFEEVVPLVPIVVGLCIDLGFDALIGTSISMLAAGCGFACGVANPFTIGVAQKLAGVPLFSGASLRILSFVLIYILLIGFINIYSKKVINGNSNITVKKEFVFDENKDRALKAFAFVMLFGLTSVLLSPFIVFLQDYTMIIIALSFFIGGVIAILLTKTKVSVLANDYGKGSFNMLPSVILILMASSIRYTMVESGLIGTVLEYISLVGSKMNKVELVLFIYLVCLVMNFFIASGSAKAFLLMPLLIPLATRFGVSPQLCILAYAYGDGFSNVFYPTNPALLISLGLINMDYRTWFKYSSKFQFFNLLLTSVLLIFGLVIGY